MSERCETCGQSGKAPWWQEGSALYGYYCAKCYARRPFDIETPVGGEGVQAHDPKSHDIRAADDQLCGRAVRGDCGRGVARSDRDTHQAPLGEILGTAAETAYEQQADTSKKPNDFAGPREKANASQRTNPSIGVGDRRPLAPPEPQDDGLSTRLKLHAFELTNGGANASQLRDDLRTAADRLEAIKRNDHDRPEPILAAQLAAGEAREAALQRERDELKAEKEADSWHQGWRVAVHQRDAAEAAIVSLQAERDEARAYARRGWDQLAETICQLQAITQEMRDAVEAGRDYHGAKSVSRWIKALDAVGKL